MSNSSPTIKNDLKFHHAAIALALAAAAAITFGPPGHLLSAKLFPESPADSAGSSAFVNELREAADRSPREYEIFRERARRLGRVFEAKEKSAASRILLIPQQRGEKLRIEAAMGRQEAQFQYIKKDGDTPLFRTTDRAQELRLLAHESESSMDREKSLAKSAIFRVHLLLDAASAAQSAAGEKLAEYSGDMAGARKIIDQELGDGRELLGYASMEDRRYAIAAIAERGALTLGESSSGIEEMALRMESDQKEALGAEDRLEQAVLGMARPFIANGGHGEEAARSKEQARVARQALDDALARAEAEIIQEKVGVKPNSATGPEAIEMALSAEWKGGLADLRQAAERLFQGQDLKIKADLRRERQAALSMAKAIVENPKLASDFEPWELAMLWQWMAPLSALATRPSIEFSAQDLYYAGQALSGDPLPSVQPAEWQSIGGALSAAAIALDLERVETSWSMGPKPTPVWKRSALLQKLSPITPTERTHEDKEELSASRGIASAVKSLAEIAEKIRLGAGAAKKP